MDAPNRRPFLFGPVARFEWAYQLRSPVLWVGFALFFLLTFGATTVDQIQIGSRGNQWMKTQGNADGVYGYDAWQVALPAA